MMYRLAAKRTGKKGRSKRERELLSDTHDHRFIAHYSLLGTCENFC